MRGYFPSILALAQSVLRSHDPCVVPFGGHMYRHSFAAFDSYCQQVSLGFCLGRCVFEFKCTLSNFQFRPALCFIGGGGRFGDPRVLWCGWGGGYCSGAALWPGNRKSLRNGSICCLCQGEDVLVKLRSNASCLYLTIPYIRF